VTGVIFSEDIAMKAVLLALTLAGVASTAPLNAQILGTRLPTPTTSTSRNSGVNGSWQAIGRDNSGNTIYERRTYDSNGNIVVQRAVRDGSGNFRVISTNTVQNGNSRDCQYSNNGSSVGDVIFGRSGNVNNDCQNSRGQRVSGGWEQVGQGRNNNSIYQRRVVDANGNVVIQRARRNSNGTFTILSSRTVRNDGNVRRNSGNNDDRRYNRDDDDDDDRRFSSNRGNGNSERGGNGRGKGKKGRD
jgi:hypothetical protein